MHKINCIIVDDEPMAREIIEFYLQKTPNLNLIKTCKNVAEAIEIIGISKVDLIFLDINMPSISGLDFAKVIDKEIKIIFTTAYREYAVDGFEINALDYLLKPFSFERFEKSISKFNHLKERDENNTSKNVASYIFIRSDRKMMKIELDKILYIESLSDYVKIHLKDKTVITRETISNMENKLDTNLFIRIHRSFIVSVNKIESYTNEFIEIHKKALPISRTYKNSVLNFLN